ncbi:zinc finger and SCAN domain-containing protein 31-like isoform X4 [Girardinichthys multiradiatus]|uniref:zinc finger and SCAN domain-containing protein 31-like isoform X4 n=1 Tax=Girardinichthys multiradiatus TaxID=208333 RepID=UPI001FAB8E19|nr:zinc finger and SCAN domain-containing protein 31-like isoform X4 [Girardinichthys multiradiatus]
MENTALFTTFFMGKWRKQTRFPGFPHIMSVNALEVDAHHITLFPINQETTQDQLTEMKEEEAELQQTVEVKPHPESQPIRGEHVELSIFQDVKQLVIKQETDASMLPPSNADMLHTRTETELQWMTEIKEEPESQQIKVEQVELYHVGVKKETDNFMLFPAYKDSSHSGPEPLQLTEAKEEPEPVEKEKLFSDHDEEQLAVKQETNTCMMTPISEEDIGKSELIKDQLLSSNPSKTEEQHQPGSNREDSGSGREEELKPEKRHQDIRNKRNNADNSKLGSHKNVVPSCETCGKSFIQIGQLTDHVCSQKPFHCPTCGKGFTVKKLHLGGCYAD